MTELLFQSRIKSGSRATFGLALALQLSVGADAFTLLPTTRNSGRGSFVAPSNAAKISPVHRLWDPLQARAFYDVEDEDEDDDDDDDDDDDAIDADSLGDWRAFRKNLASAQQPAAEPDDDLWNSKPAVKTSTVSEENVEILLTQSKQLGEEYKKEAWAHEVTTPEVGGLIVRMPLEVELYRNHRHSMVGRKLRKLHAEKVDPDDAACWYAHAQSLVEEEMLEIAASAGDGGQIDATELSDESTEMLQLYLDNQETWQEVCLVLDKDDEEGSATTLVLNRPMALKLTENLAHLVLNGAYQTMPSKVVGQSKVKVDLVKFMLAFGNECAVYVGGTDNQDQSATMIHGIADLPGAREIAKGSGIYTGGLEAAVEGVLYGKYNPMDFRFFVGCNSYEESTLDVAVLLGKYQAVACARAMVLKQCISLPKPLWHEVLELCGGHMAEVSAIEMSKRDDVLFQVMEEDDDDDMLDELNSFDDEDEYYED